MTTFTETKVRLAKWVTRSSGDAPYQMPVPTPTPSLFSRGYVFQVFPNVIGLPCLPVPFPQVTWWKALGAILLVTGRGSRRMAVVSEIHE